MKTAGFKSLHVFSLFYLTWVYIEEIIRSSKNGVEVKSNLLGNVQNYLIKMKQLLIDVAISIYFFVIIIYTCTDTEGLVMVTLIVIEL